MTIQINNQHWKVWGIAVILLVSIRAVSDVPTENSRFFLFIMYIVPIWGWVLCLNFRRGRDLMAYLEKYHHEKWKEITHVPGIGSGDLNSFRSLPFIFSDENLNDENVNILKRNYISFMKFGLSVFISVIPLFLLVVLPW